MTPTKTPTTVSGQTFGNHCCQVDRPPCGPAALASRSGTMWFMATHPPSRAPLPVDGPGAHRSSVSGGPAALLLAGLVGMTGGVLLAVSDVAGGGMLAAVGLVLTAVSCTGAAVWTGWHARRSEDAFWWTFVQSVRAFGRWFAFFL